MYGYLPKLFFLVLIQAFLANCCIQHERQALLKFKGGVKDPSNRLATWSGSECCNWVGIKCSSRTGHVVKLNLRNSYFHSGGYPDYKWNNHSLSGKISSALQFLSDLKHLDMSYNNFTGNKFPKFISNFKYLNYLNLSSTGLSGIMPPELGNVTKLQYLDLNYMPGVFLSNVWWLSQLTSLKYLAMMDVNFLDSREWAQALNTLPLLQILHLGWNNLTTIPASMNGLNYSSLKILSLTGNKFSARIPDWIGELTKLTILDLGYCSFVGSIPNQLNNLTALKTLALWGNNYMEGPIPPLKNLKSLTKIIIADIDIGEDIGEVISKLANDTLGKLEDLWLVGTNLTGNLTGWVSKLHSLINLFLDSNNLDGTVPIEFGNITRLEHLDLNRNSLTGEFSEAHLTGLSNLKYFSLNFNYLTIKVGRNWIPPFQLEYLSLAGCKLEPHFPSWLRNQSQMNHIELRNTGIAGTVPNWFWNLSSLGLISLSNNHLTGMLPLSIKHLTSLNSLYLNNNSFEGGIPSLPRSTMVVDLSYNLLSRPLPHHIEAPSLSVLSLSNNLLNGTIEHLTCGLNSLDTLNLAENSLSGNVPYCWPSTLTIVNMAHNLFNGTIEHLTCGLDRITILNLEKNNLSGNLPSCWPSTLKVVNMASNKFSGAIPSSMGNSSSLEYLQLNNNSLTGELPSTLQFCKNLMVIDIGENQISGQIPEWIGENLINLKILRLRSNLFSSKIPIELMHLKNLQVLDCASNHISGSIPPNLELLTAMASSTGLNKSLYEEYLGTDYEYYHVSILEVTKDLDLEFTTTLSLLRSIDLSCNNLTGEIPQKIITLFALQSLNLSNNHLYGSIPMQIGEMQLLESLDLRMNELTGIIPKSFANLNFLTTLNLSYNNLSGPIPTGNQLQSLDDPYIYIGNNYLCGTPLSKSCSNSEIPSGYETYRNDDQDKVLFYLFVVLGFVSGFWIVCGILLFKANWRYCFFQKVDNVFDRVHVFMAVYIARLVKAEERCE